MYHSRTMNNKINHLHEKCLLIVHSDKTSSFKKVSKQTDLCQYTLEIYRSLLQSFSKKVTFFHGFFFKKMVQYNLWHPSEFSVANVKSTFLEIKYLPYLRPKIWDLLSKELKEFPNVSVFKNTIKKWKPQNCPCRLCKKYVQNLGFI